MRTARANAYQAKLRRSEALTEEQRQWAQDKMEMETMAKDGMLAEKGGPMNMDFKGFSPALKHQFEEENRQLVFEKAQLKYQEKAEDIQHVKIMNQLNRSIMQSQAEEARQRKQADLRQQQANRFQMIEATARAAKSKSDASGEVGPQFYQNFGTSFR